MNKSAKILIVDDEPDVRNLVNCVLSDLYTCYVAESGQDAIELLRLHDIDVIVTDVVMEGIDGFGLLAHAREIAPDTVTIMVSGYNTNENAVEAMARGVFDYLAKPFDLEQLYAAVARALTHREALRARNNRAIVDAQISEQVNQPNIGPATIVL